MHVLKTLRPDKYISHMDLSPPADGGLMAYLVLIASFLTNGLVFGIINSFSLIYPVLEQTLIKDGCEYAGSKAALVGALGMGVTFIMSPFAGALTIFIGIRVTAVIGGLIATTGMFISSFFVHHVNVLYFTYGILYSTGSSLAFTPSLAILGSYFDKRIGLANGFATIGGSVFTIILPPIIQHIIDNNGLVTLFQVLTGLTFVVVLCACMFKPIPIMVIKRDVNSSTMTMAKTVINTHIWTIRSYRYWAICMPIALFGYFIPYVHIKKLAEINFPTSNTNIPLQCMAFTSCLGVVSGMLADRPWVNRVLILQVAFYGLGFVTIALPYVHNFYLLVTIALVMGIFDGAFCSMIGPIAIELCGGENAASSIGFVLGLCATPLCVGPPVAAEIYDLTQSYNLPFGMAGIPPIIGATLMFSVRYAHKQELKKAIIKSSKRPTPLSTEKAEDSPGPYRPGT